MIGRRKKDEMQISEAELRAMTADMVEMHNATFPQMREALSDLGVALRRQRQANAVRESRRRFLLGSGGVVLGTLVLSACGGDDEEDSAAQNPPPVTDPVTDPGTEAPGGESNKDAEALKLNASIENLAVFAYGAALEAAPKGMFGKTVPAAVAEFATNAKMQHTEHAEAFNAALKNAGGQEYTDPTPALAQTVKDMFAKIDSVPGLAMLALTLENTAAATYIKQLETLTSEDAISAVATIAPVERQHAAILSYILGEYPIPDTFVKLGETKTSLGARTTADLSAS